MAAVDPSFTAVHRERVDSEEGGPRAPRTSGGNGLEITAIALDLMLPSVQVILLLLTEHPTFLSTRTSRKVPNNQHRKNLHETREMNTNCFEFYDFCFTLQVSRVNRCGS